MSLWARIYLVCVLVFVVLMIPIAFALTWLFPIGFPRFIEACFERYNYFLDVYDDLGVDSRDRF